MGVSCSTTNMGSQANLRVLVGKDGQTVRTCLQIACKHNAPGPQSHVPPDAEQLYDMVHALSIKIAFLPSSRTSISDQDAIRFVDNECPVSANIVNLADVPLCAQACPASHRCALHTAMHDQAACYKLQLLGPVKTQAPDDCVIRCVAYEALTC